MNNLLLAIGVLAVGVIGGLIILVSLLGGQP